MVQRLSQLAHGSLCYGSGVVLGAGISHGRGTRQHGFPCSGGDNLANVASLAPLIVTLELDDASFLRFQTLRQQHFPAALNKIPAHVTLFHHLPGEEFSTVQADLERLCSPLSPLPIRCSGVRFLGKGVACSLESEQLVHLRKRCAEAWLPWLTPQDRQGFRPHITIQNKVHPAEARTLYEQWKQSFTPFEITGEGLALWQYLGGPWEKAGTFPFRG